MRFFLMLIWFDCILWWVRIYWVYQPINPDILSEDVIELLIYHQPDVKPSLTLRPFGVLGYVAGHSLTHTITTCWWPFLQLLGDDLYTGTDVWGRSVKWLAEVRVNYKDTSLQILSEDYKACHKSTHGSPGSVPASFEVSQSDTQIRASLFPRVTRIRESKLVSIGEFASTYHDASRHKYLEVYSWVPIRNHFFLVVHHCKLFYYILF